MHIGTIIKIERLRQDLKQETLAKGICSIAHLSRIENGNSVPNPKILNGLSEKLGIPLVSKMTTLNATYQMRMGEISDQYITIINKRDREGASHLIDHLMELLKMDMLDTQKRLDLDLLRLRLLLVQKGNSKNVLQEIGTYNEIEPKLTPLQIFNVNLIKGIASYKCGNLKMCLEALTKASNFLELAPIPMFERGDFAYVHSVALMADSRKFEALEQAKYALDYFKSIMANKRAVECMLICGVAYKQIGQLEIAIQQFREVERICNQFQMKSFFGIVFQNLGDAHSAIGNSELAITYFKKSLIAKVQPDEIVYSIFSLVKEYARLEKEKDLSHWLHEGFKLLPKLGQNKKILFEKHFNVYNALHSNDQNRIINELIVAFEYFKQQNKKNQMFFYAKMLAELYSKMGRYKSAVEYYKIIVK